MIQVLLMAPAPADPSHLYLSINVVDKVRMTPYRFICWFIDSIVSIIIRLAVITSVMQSPGNHLSVTSDVVHLFRIFGFFCFVFIEDLILLASSILLSRTACLLALLTHLLTRIPARRREGARSHFPFAQRRISWRTQSCCNSTFAFRSCFNWQQKQWILCCPFTFTFQVRKKGLCWPIYTFSLLALMRVRVHRSIFL